MASTAIPAFYDLTMHDVDHLARRLAALDSMYSGSLPGFMDAHGERVARVREARARDGIPLVLGERVTLPSSVVRRAVAIEGLQPTRVVLFGDADGLAAHLTGTSVSVVRADAPPAKQAVADLSVFEASDLALTAARLESALAAVGPSGTVMARLRWPFDRGFYEHVRVMGVKVIGYLREVDHALFPGGHVSDGAGDLVLLSGAIATSVPELPTPRSGELSQLLPVSVDAPPYAWFDMDGLDLGRGATLETFAAKVTEISGRTPELSDLKSYEDKHILCWYDDQGRGFVAELTPELGHLLVSFVPYDDVLDQATMAAAFELFADEDTRVRPRRTERTPERTVFA